jgi:hypothetical protein
VTCVSEAGGFNDRTRYHFKVYIQCAIFAFLRQVVAFCSCCLLRLVHDTRPPRAFVRSCSHLIPPIRRLLPQRHI